MGAVGGRLTYIPLERLIELKLAASRHRDLADVVELIRENGDDQKEIRQHLDTVHPPYAERFDLLIQQAQEQGPTK